MMSDSGNRRDQERMNVEGIDIHGTIASIKRNADIPSPMGTKINFQLVDFSPLGYRIQVDVPLPEHTKIQFHFNGIGRMEDFLKLDQNAFNELNHILLDDQGIDCLGAVSSCRPVDESPGYNLGVKILETSLHHKFHALCSSVSESH